MVGLSSEDHRARHHWRVQRCGSAVMLVGDKDFFDHMNFQDLAFCMGLGCARCWEMARREASRGIVFAADKIHALVWD